MRWIFSIALVSVIVALPAHGARHAGSETMTIRLISVTTQAKVLVDRPPKGQGNTGDVVWAKSVLRNEVPQFGRSKGALVGSDTATLTIVSATQGSMKVAVKLPGGTLNAAGKIGPESPQTIAVVGGTGAFAGVRGTSEVVSLDASGDRSRNVYRLRLP